MAKKTLSLLPVDSSFFTNGSYVTTPADEVVRLHMLTSLLTVVANIGSRRSIMTDTTILLVLSDWYETIYDLCRLHGVNPASGNTRFSVRKRLTSLVRNGLVTCFNDDLQTHMVRRRRGVTIGASIAVSRFYGLTPLGVTRLTEILRHNTPYVPSVDTNELRTVVNELKQKLLQGRSLTWPQICDDRLRCWTLKG